MELLAGFDTLSFGGPYAIMLNIDTRPLRLNVFEILQQEELKNSHVENVQSRTYGPVNIRVSKSGRFIRFEDPVIQQDYECRCDKRWSEMLNY